MSIRKIIQINEEKCDGCGDCISACAEGAIQIIGGKAKVVNDSYCDGLGACLGKCPQGAITIIEREATAFDQAAVQKHLAQQKRITLPVHPVGGGCPGSAMQQIDRESTAGVHTESRPAVSSQLGHWPVQLMLIPPHAPFLANADILICADCVPFALPDFHSRYLTGRAVLVGCPKLDNLNHYAEKMKAIFAAASPRSIMVLKMEVPCCSGIAQVVLQARNEVAPDVPIEVLTIGVRGEIECEPARIR